MSTVPSAAIAASSILLPDGPPSGLAGKLSEALIVALQYRSGGQTGAIKRPVGAVADITVETLEGGRSSRCSPFLLSLDEAGKRSRRHMKITGHTTAHVFRHYFAAMSAITTMDTQSFRWPDGRGCRNERRDRAIRRQASSGGMQGRIDFVTAARYTARR